MKPVLSAKTTAEMQAGRDALLKGVRTSRLDEACRELNFKHHPANIMASCTLASDVNEWQVFYTITLWGKIVHAGDEPMVDFPSETVIATMALLAGARHPMDPRA